jgi:hypothetical protein
MEVPMKGIRSIILFLAVILVAESINPAAAFACWVCKRSPTGWGFCRAGYLRGHSDCAEKVVDPFNGTTDCEIVSWGTCGTSAEGDEPGEILYPVSDSPCRWADVRRHRLI